MASRPSHQTVVIVGHGGAGKTTLAEALLGLAGIEGGRSGLLDHEPEERERGHSVSLAAAALEWRGRTITLVDTPGTPEAYGDAFGALPGATLALFVVDAASGLRPEHDELWAACEPLGVPRVVFLNKFDAPSAVFEPHLEALRERSGKAIAPVHMPLGVGEEFDGVVDLLRLVAVRRVGGRRTEGELPAERRTQAERNREQLVEAIVEHDDALLERYLDGDVPAVAELGAAFARGIADGGFFPVLCGSAALPIGVRLLADFLVDETPAAADGGSARAQVVKTYGDPYVGRVTLLAVQSGELAPERELVVARTGRSVRLHHPFTPMGADQQPVGRAPAGTVVGCAKLDDVRTGDLLSEAAGARAPTVVTPPSPQHRVAIVPAGAGDEERMSTALARLLEEDPSLRMERDLDTGQTVLRTYGPGHLAVAMERLRRKFGVAVEPEPLRCAYRETLSGTGRAVGKHVKQSGGHGQYGIAEIEVAPLPRGEGFAFRNEIVGGVIPRQFIPSVEKGVRDAMARGVLTGYPVVDVMVRLVDGKHHTVDSSDMAFQTAGALAFRAAARAAGLVLLEPVMKVQVTVPDDLVGEVMGDLSARRGRIQGTEQVPGPGASLGRTLVHALVPQAELDTYVPELRSLTSGAARVDLAYDHHDLVPPNVAARLAEPAREGVHA